MGNLIRIGQQKRFGGGATVQLSTPGLPHFIANEFWNLDTPYPGRKISVLLKNEAGSVLANTAVKWAVFDFSGAEPYNWDFMQRSDKGVYTTDSNGLFEIFYEGLAPLGSFVYLAIIHPNTSPTESLIWKVTIT